MVGKDKRPSGYLRVEFLNRHPELKDIIDSDVITDYLDDCPVAVVEYKGTLKNESKNQRKNRMQSHKVYNGDIRDLVNGLRNTYPTKRSMSGYALLLDVYESIKGIDTLDLEKAKMQIAGSEEGVNEDTQVEEAVPTTVQEVAETPVNLTDVVDAQNMSTASIGEDERLEEKEKQSETSQEEKLNNGISEDNSTEVVEKEEEIPTPTSELKIPTETTSVKEDASTRIQTNKQPHKEDKKMAELNLDAMVDKAAGLMKDGAEGTANAGTALPKAGTGASTEIQNSVIDSLSGTAETRNAWTQANAVNAVIMVQQPAALRLVGEPVGTVIKAGTKDEDVDGIIKEKFEAFIKAVSGKAMGIDAFSTAADDVKFANCVDETSVAKAKAMAGIYMDVYGNPRKEIRAFVDASKASAPIKGVTIGDKHYPMDALLALLLDETNGAIYGAGTKDLPEEDQVVFSLNFATRRQSNAVSGNSKASTQKQMVIKTKNKRAFLEDDTHKKYLMTQYDTENESRANFKAEIMVDGKPMNAVCSVWELDDKGNRVEKGKDKDNNTKYGKKICSINVSVPVRKVVKDVDKEFCNGETQPSVIGQMWGVVIPVAEVKDFGNITDQRSSLTFAALTKLLSGQGTASDAILKKSKVYADLMASAEKAQAAEDNATAEDLGM